MLTLAPHPTGPHRPPLPWLKESLGFMAGRSSLEVENPPTPSRKLRPESLESHDVRGKGRQSGSEWSPHGPLHPMLVLAQSSASSRSQWPTQAERATVLLPCLAKLCDIRNGTGWL